MLICFVEHETHLRQAGAIRGRVRRQFHQHSNDEKQVSSYNSKSLDLEAGASTDIYRTLCGT